MFLIARVLVYTRQQAALNMRKQTNGNVNFTRSPCRMSFVQEKLLKRTTDRNRFGRRWFDTERKFRLGFYFRRLSGVRLLLDNCRNILFRVQPV